MAGQVVHFEVPADDLERAQRFYADAFGWQLTPIPEMSYTMVQTGPSDQNGRPSESGMINGGMMARSGGPATAPVITITVDDIDAALATVEQHGGKTAVGRQPVGDMGFAAYFVDPEGNTMGLWQNA
jgi:predicted enzyme related to lactoylglutathione lyase